MRPITFCFVQDLLPTIPPIPGIEADHIVDSTGILNNDTLPEESGDCGGGRDWM